MSFAYNENNNNLQTISPNLLWMLRLVLLTAGPSCMTELMAWHSTTAPSCCFRASRLKCISSYWAGTTSSSSMWRDKTGFGLPPLLWHLIVILCPISMGSAGRAGQLGETRRDGSSVSPRKSFDIHFCLFSRHV